MFGVCSDWLTRRLREASTPKIKFTLNGKLTVASYEPGMHFLEVLREECGIVSAKDGCAPEGACGCCAILVDGRPVLACLRKPEQMEGLQVVTLEGVPKDVRHVLGEAFALEGGVQCGFCIPGIVVRASSLLRQNQTGDRAAVAKALDGHLCRCTGYGRIMDAIQTAGEAFQNGGRFPSKEPRRHLFFGEEFGWSRNPAFANGHHEKANGNGIGRSSLRYGGMEQAMGEKPFVDDLRVPGMFHGALVLSEHPRAKVLAIRTAAALAMQGIVRVFTAADVPGERGTGLNIPDLPVFVAVGETTCCVGDFLALVVGDSAFHARQAAEKVQVDYEVLDPVTDPFAALEPGAPQVHAPGNLHESPNKIETTAFSRGDVDAALAASIYVIEHTFATQPIEPAFLEPEACLALPQGKRVKVHSQSQGSVFDQKQIARVLNLPIEDVEIELAASGGAFGAKEELSIQAQTAMAAFLLQRPVKTVLTRQQSTQHHVKRHPMTLHYTVGADAKGHLLAVRARIVGDAGGYAGTSGKCLLRAACHSCGPYRVPNVDIESTAVFTNNPTSGAMRGFGTNQAHFAMEGMMDILADKVGIDGYDIRMRNILNPGDAFATGQIMRDSVLGMRRSLEAVKDIYKTAKYAGIGCGIKSTGIGNGTVDSGHILIRVMEGGRVNILTGYTEMGQGLFTTIRQAVCEETGLPTESMTVRWDQDLGNMCGETWASRATTLSCAAAQRAASKLAADLKQSTIEQLAGREYGGDYICDFTTRPGTPEALKNPTTHLTFSYSTQVVILGEDGRIERVVAAHDVGHALNPRLCAEQMEGGVHMGLGYALSENFSSTNGRPDSLYLRDLGIVRAKDMPKVDVILIEVPDEVGGYGAKGVGEIGCVSTAGAVAGALYSYDGIRRFRLPMQDSPAAAPSVPKSRRKVLARAEA
jgi:CO/xanthine dehydrogenase Mo-binding subunit/aerobic-type carbon monoxide dehydrogenase small subunit (CoxS/CutS family)